MAHPDLMDIELEMSRGKLALACLARMNWGSKPGDMIDLDREELGALFEVLKLHNERAEALLLEMQRAQMKPQT